MYYHYPYKTRESFAKMTAHDAWAIQRDVLTLEFPFIGGKGLQYALFKYALLKESRWEKAQRLMSVLPYRTYGISTISKLLIETGQLSTPTKAAKVCWADEARVIRPKTTSLRRSQRYADTGCIFTEWLDNAPESERANAAYARVNFLHSHYQKAGKISNDDMLYTLAVLALEPKRWIEQYEWRKLNEMELCACKLVHLQRLLRTSRVLRVVVNDAVWFHSRHVLEVRWRCHGHFVRMPSVVQIRFHRRLALARRPRNLGRSVRVAAHGSRYQL